METAAKLVTSSTGAERNDNLRNDLNDSAWKKVISPPRKPRATASHEDGGGAIALPDDDGHYQNTQNDNVSYADLRAEAQLYGQLRRECLQKAAQAFQAKNGSVAQHHANNVCFLLLLILLCTFVIVVVVVLIIFVDVFKMS